MFDKKFLTIVLGVHATLYTVLVFVAGLVFRDRWAVILIIASQGVAYASVAAFTMEKVDAAKVLTIISILMAAMAGLSLLWGAFL